jgi:hypothetical protein
MRSRSRNLLRGALYHCDLRVRPALPSGVRAVFTSARMVRFLLGQVTCHATPAGFPRLCSAGAEGQDDPKSDRQRKPTNGNIRPTLAASPLSAAGPTTTHADLQLQLGRRKLTCPVPISFRRNSNGNTLPSQKSPR